MYKIDPKKPVQELHLDHDCFKFQVPFAMSISGPSLVGKSEFIVKLIENREKLFTSKFHRIIYCQPESLYSVPNPIYQKLKKSFPMTEIFFGLPTLEQISLENNCLPCLLILDDLMNKLLNSSEMNDLFSIHIHHKNISCIFTLQNYFAPSRFGKTIARNVHYRILFYNRVELLELRNMSLQLSSKPNFLLSNFKFLEENFPDRYSHYILIDGHGHSKSRNMHIRTQIFPDTDGSMRPIIFIPTN
jgi:hypothetical protein